MIRWAVSSVGRASVLQTGGHWFESSIAHHTTPPYWAASYGTSFIELYNE